KQDSEHRSVSRWNHRSSSPESPKEPRPTRIRNNASITSRVLSRSVSLNDLVSMALGIIGVICAQVSGTWITGSTQDAPSLDKRIIKGRPYGVGFDLSHQRLQEGAPS